MTPRVGEMERSHCRKWKKTRGKMGLEKGGEGRFVMNCVGLGLWEWGVRLSAGQGSAVVGDDDVDMPDGLHVFMSRRRRRRRRSRSSD